MAKAKAKAKSGQHTTQGQAASFAWFVYYDEDRRAALAVSLSLGILVARRGIQRRRAVLQAKRALIEQLRDYVEVAAAVSPKDLLQPVAFQGCLNHLTGFIAAIQRDQERQRGLWDCGFSNITDNGASQPTKTLNY